MSLLKSAFIYIDGACRGNPGPAGIGIIIEDGNKKCIRKLYKYIGETTNNVAEYTALIYALQEALILRAEQVIINSDSELLTRQLNGRYKIKNENIRQLFQQFLHLKTGFKEIRVNLIGRKDNAEADRLANRALDTWIDDRLKSA
jgi:ribonuclease HI